MEGQDEQLYAGRWVARLRGRIIAQGGTPEQARRAARSRYKETPEITFIPINLSPYFPPILYSVRAALPEGLTIYLAGGAVRDILLGRNLHDLDFAVKQDAIKIARRVADTLNADFYPLDSERDTGRVIVTKEDGSRILLDFAAFRGPDLDADLLRRDFTINAIALNLNDDTIHDPLAGALDLKERRLRACSPSTFTDDPVRILRGVRLAANFGFRILPKTRIAMQEAAGLLGNISPERIRDELFRILDGLRPAACLRAFDLLGALKLVMPELAALKGVEQPPPHVHDVWEHTLATLSHLESLLSALAPDKNPDGASDYFIGLMVVQIGRYRQKISEALASSLSADRSLRSLIFLAALFHDVAKCQTKKVDEEGKLRFWDHDLQGAEIAANRMRNLAMSNDEITRVETDIRNHMRILYHTNRLVQEGKSPSRRAVYRFFKDSSSAGVDICLLALADIRATYEQTLPREVWAAVLEVVRLMLENWFEKPAESIAILPLVNGNDLMHEFKISSGKIVGEMLEAIREAQAMGEITTRAQALDFAREKFL